MRFAFLYSFVLISGFFTGGCGGGFDAAEADVTPRPVFETPPNIVLILADDLGHGSLNSYGARHELIQTPHIDSLADDGVRFTDAYAPSSVCSPTRYGVLMGRYPWRTAMKADVLHWPAPLWPSMERMNLAKWLQARGYVTGTIGKWHLGYGMERHTTSIEEWIDTTMPGPEALGFDYSFSLPQNHGDRLGVYFENGEIVGYDDQGQLVGLRSTNRVDYGTSTYGEEFLGFDVPQRVDELVTEQITTRAIQWMEQQAIEEEQRFFLYFAPVAVHNPITPSMEMSGTSGAGSYGDFIHDLDRSIGRILDSLDEMGIADETIVIFTSDNGGDIPGNPDRPQVAAIESGLAINGDLRGDKHSIWEGGTRVPLLVRMPDDSQTLAGRVSGAIVNLTDLFATLVDLVGNGAGLPDGAGPDSISFLPAMLNDSAADLRPSTITANHQGILAIRSGDWKWIEGTLPPGFEDYRGIPDPRPDEALPQLYNLLDDPEETRDLSDRHPDVVERLQRELSTIRGSD